MRLHHLSLSAFGPFAGTERIDFDALCDAGLFLLTGPTGAGKTTVLDAICFALYGSVPGVRGVKTLKSQHSDADARPEVVLGFSVRDRRFVLRRSPEWSRPKRRGSGWTTEHASATLLEVTSGEEHLLSSRAQEVGHFVGELIGMQATQFMQVAMLPQGEFQKFLRASSQDRHAVLQHLFRTDRYARIEDWVHDRSRELRERSTTLQHDVARVLDAVADRLGRELPDTLVGDALVAPEAQEVASTWVDALLAEATTGCASVLDEHAVASRGLEQLRSEHDEAVRRQELQRRRDQALSTLEELSAGDETEQRARRLLDGDDRASRCLPLLRLLDEAAEQRDEAARQWNDAAAVLDTLDGRGLEIPTGLTARSLAGLEQEARARITRLESLLPRERELARAREDLGRSESHLASVSAELAAARDRSAQLPALLAEHRSRVESATAAASRTEPLSLQLGQARERLTAAREAERCTTALAALREVERDARDAAADARQRMQDLTARRLAGIAAELAGGLRDGEACQVCGSTQHPAPATPAPDHVTEVEQERAATAYDAARGAHVDAANEVSRTEQRLEGLVAAAAGLDTHEAEALVKDLSSQLASAEAARADLDDATAAVERITVEQQDVTAAVHDLELSRAALTQEIATHRASIAILDAELAAEVDLDAPVSEQILRWTAGAASLSEAREALGAREHAEARLEELRQHAGAAARDQGFDEIGQARAATLEGEERRRLEVLLESRAESAAKAAAVLEDPAVRAAASKPRPDVPALTTGVAEAEASLGALARTLHQREDVQTALTRLRGRLEDAFDRWAPVREEFLRVEAMSQLVRGTGAENQLQMRLSAYVLATRLDQVVDAANERLAHMRDQRYLLQRTGRATRKGAQAGLGLEVVDQWTGDVRDPTSLSGGETFVVSLALALGLADVVSHEAGGTEIETLFVDEGFGSLDADTLDDVMDRLDDLRAGGRAVGVVSHVSEMRNRIPTQLHVDKGRDGSGIAVRTAVG